MGLFNPKLEQTGGSAVTPKAAPQLPNVAGAVADVAVKASSIFTQVGAAQAEGQNNSVVAKFNQELVRISEGVNQGVVTSQAASTAARSKYAQFVTNNPSLAGELSKAYKGVNDTTDAFNAKQTEQEKLRAQAITAAGNKGFVTSTMSEEEVNVGLADFAKYQMAANELSALTSKQTYTITKDKEEKRVADIERKDKSDKATSNFISAGSEPFNTKLNELYGSITQGELDPTDGVIAMKQLITSFRSEVDGSGTESKELAATLMKPYEDLAATYEKMVTDPANAKFYEGQVKAKIAQAKTSILATPEYAHAIAISNLTGNTVAGLLPMNQAVTSMFGASYNKGVDGKGKTPDVTGSVAGDDFISVISTATKVLNSQGTPEDNLPAVDELGKHVGQILKSIDVYATATERPEEYNKVVDFIASPQYASVVKAGLIDADAAFNAQQVLKQDYEKVLMPLIRDKVQTTFATHVGVLAGFKDTNVPIEDAVNVEIRNGGIVFTAKDDLPMEGLRPVPYARMIKDLNNSVGKQMNKLVRMNAHLEGSTDYKAYAEASLPTLLGHPSPEGTAVKKPQVEEAKVDDSILHGKDAVAEVEKQEGTLNTVEKRIVELEGYSPNEYKDDKGITTSGVGQTGDNIGKTFKEVVKPFIEKTKEVFPEYDSFSEEVQAELVQLMYRGDVKSSHEWVKLFNEGDYAKAGKEVLNHKELKDRLSKGEDGVTKRLKEASNVFNNII